MLGSVGQAFQPALKIKALCENLVVGLRKNLESVSEK
jgi:hypothetical protein